MSEAAYCKVVCGSCELNIEYPTSAAGQTVPCPHCGGSVFLPYQDRVSEDVDALVKPRTSSQPTALITSRTFIVWPIVIAAFVGALIFGQLHQEKREAENQNAHQNALKEVKGAFGWNLGDVLPDNLTVTTNDALLGITYNFDPSSDITNAQFMPCFLVLTENRQIAEINITIVIDSGEDELGMGQYNTENLKKTLTDKYGLDWIEDGSPKTYVFGKSPRQAELSRDTASICLNYKDSDLYKMATDQQAKRKESEDKQIQNNLNGHL